MYARIATYGIVGLAAILVGACAPDKPSCASKETIDSLKRTAIDLTNQKEGFRGVDASRSTTEVSGIKQLASYPIEAHCTATLSQHLRFAATGDASKAGERNFTMPVRFDAKRTDRGTDIVVYGAIVPPDICTFLSRFTKDVGGWRAERVPLGAGSFKLKHEPSGMSCGGSDFYKNTPTISCGSLPGDAYFALPSTWEALDREGAACLSADAFKQVRNESHSREWFKRYDASHDLRVWWKQEGGEYKLGLDFGPR